MSHQMFRSNQEFSVTNRGGDSCSYSVVPGRCATVCQGTGRG